MANQLSMFGCADAQPTRECLADFPLSTNNAWSRDWTGHMPEANIRVLRELDYASNYWTRSSADGRFVAQGGGSSLGATIIDLQRSIGIPASGFYDLGFFPDQAGFFMSGSSAGDAGCSHQVLTALPSAISSALGYLSPIDYENRQSRIQAA